MNRRILLFLLLFCACTGAKAQLIINELSQGTGAKEYVEFVVTGTRTCTDSTFDLRGWIFDDNPAWYGAGGGQGIAEGCMRFRSVANWAAVPYGSIIIVYNSVDRNTNIPPDDPTDANHDYVYIVPDNSTLLQKDDTHPPGGNSNASISYSTATSFTNGGDWATVSLNNAADAFHTVSPSLLTSAYHSIAFGTLTNGTAANIYFAASSGSTVYYLASALYNNQLAWSVGAAGVNETPGIPNGGANTTWINNMRVQIAAPVIGLVTINQPTCAGNNGSLVLDGLTPNAVYNVSYSLNSTPVTGLTITANASGQVIIPNLSAGTYSNITVTIGTCSNTKTGNYVLINSANPAQPVATSNSPVCTGGTLTLNTPVVSGATYSWTGPNGFTASIPAPSVTNVTTAATGTYSVTITVGGCISTAGTTAVVINPTPAKPTASATSVCAGQTLNLSATTVAGATYTWTGPGGYTSSVQNPTIANATVAMSGYYGVTATIGSCSSVRDSVNVVIKPIPTSTVAGSNSPVCEGNAVNLSATNVPGGVSYSWTGPGYTSNVQNPSFTATATSGGSYGVITTLNGCSSTRSFTTVVVNPRPVISSVVGFNPTSCGGNNGYITFFGFAPNTSYTFSYLKNGIPTTATFISDPATGILTIGLLTSGTYTFTSITGPGGCSAAPIAPVVLSDPSAPAAPAITSNSPICAGSTLQLSATGIAGATFQWGGPNSFSAASATVTITNTTIADAGTYTVTQRLNGCTSAPASTVVVISPKPATPTITTNSPICSGSTLTLSGASSTPGVTYVWSGPNGFTSTTQNPAIPNATVNAGGTYTLTTSIGICSSVPATAGVIVNATPATPVLVSSNSPVCAGQVITINVSVPAGTTTISWTGPNSFTATTAGISIPNATVANSGTYTAVFTNNGCLSTPLNVPVVVNPSPVITSAVGTNPTSCASATGSILLTGLAPNTTYDINYSRNGAPAFVQLTSNASGNITMSNLTAATYTNIVARLGNCASAPSGPVTLADPNGPAAPAAGNNGPICSGTTLNLTASAITGAVYNWTGPNGFSSTAQNPSIANATIAAAGNYIVTVTVGGCSSVPSITTAVVNQTPVAPVITSNSPVCVGNTLSLNAASTAGATYSWTGPNSFTANVQSPNISNVTIAASGVYTVTATLGTCVSQSVNQTITVVPIPGAPGVTTPLVYCQDVTALPLTATGTNLRYYTTATGGNGVTSLIPSTATAGTFNYYVSQSTSGCEGPRAQIVVIINPKPAAPVVTPSYTYCQFSPASQLTAAGTGIQWFATATGNTPLSAAPTPSTLVPGTFNYYVSQKSGNCESDRIQVTVIVLPKPAPPGVQSPLYLCQYDTVQLTADGQNLLWYLHPTGGGGQPQVIPNAGNVDSFFYYVTQTVNGCESDRTRLQVFVNYKPNGIIVPSRPWLCAEDTISFIYYGNARPDAIYNWKSPSPESHYVSGGGVGPYVVQYDSAGQQYIELTINNKGCISDVFHLPVTVRPLPALSFVLKPEGCVDETVNVALSGITSGIDRYDWNFDNGRIIYNTATGGPYGIKWSTAGTKVVSVIATSAMCGSKAYRDTIDIHPNPDARISRAMSGTVCTGDSVELSVVNEPGSTYMWSPYQFFTDRARQASTVFATPNLSGNITVTVTSSKSCSSTDSIYIDTKPCCEVYFPNAFSPNGDGKNDVFRAVTIGNHDVATFRVFNRWGQVVYESKSERQGWDGTFNGKEQELGNYYYYFKYRCSNSGDYLEQKGEFMLVR